MPKKPKKPKSNSKVSNFSQSWLKFKNISEKQAKIELNKIRKKIKISLVAEKTAETIEQKEKMNQKLKRLDDSVSNKTIKEENAEKIKQEIKAYNEQGFASSTLTGEIMREIIDEKLKNINLTKQWFNEIREKIYLFVYFRVDEDVSIAHELTNEAFRKFLEDDSIRPSNEEFYRAFLYKIAGNLTIDWQRKIKEEIKIEEGGDEWSEDSENIVNNAIDPITENIINDKALEIDLADELKKTKKLLKKLKPEYRDIIILRDFREFTYEEIALIMGKKVSNCYKLYERAIAKLKKVSEN